MAFYLLGEYNVDDKRVAVLDTDDGSIEFIEVRFLPKYITKVDICGVSVFLHSYCKDIVDTIQRGKSMFLREQGTNNYMIALNRWNNFMNSYNNMVSARKDPMKLETYYEFTIDVNLSLQTLNAQGYNVSELVSKANRMWQIHEDNDRNDSVDCFRAYLQNRSNK